MSDGSTIEWLGWPGYRPASWNPTRGCTRVSEGCRNCYAEVMAARFSKPGQWGHGIAEMRGGDHRWTGRVELNEDKLLLPLRWRKPRCIFVNSTSDLFHERLANEAIDKVFAVMALCPQHLFICLTKRSERLQGYHSMARSHHVGLEALGCTMAELDRDPRSQVGAGVILQGDIAHLKIWPLPNVILGVSVEDRPAFQERSAHLAATPAAYRMISAEPLLGDLGDLNLDHWTRPDWIITGGESGPGARPVHPDWFRQIRNQCQAAGVAYYHKQNGAWAVVLDRDRDDPGWQRCDTVARNSPSGTWLNLAGGRGFHGDRVLRVAPGTKKSSGRLLDGRTHDECPERPEVLGYDA